jgi:hypothetical protein
VSAAIAASVHATTPEVLLLDVPPDYLCPISKQLMVQPVMVETGHTYEAAAIHKWLDANDVCPVSGRKLSSKQTAPNYALKHLVADWAAAHSVTLPPAPVYSIANTDYSRPRSTAATEVTEVAEASMHGRSQSAPGTNVGIDIEDIPTPKSHSSGIKMSPRCTRTRWAVATIALLLTVAVAVGLAVVLPRVTNRSKEATTITGTSKHIVS